MGINCGQVLTAVDYGWGVLGEGFIRNLCKCIVSTVKISHILTGDHYQVFVLVMHG